MSICLTRLSAEKLRSAVKARGRGKHNFLSFHISERATADKQAEKRIKILPCVPEILRAKAHFVMRWCRSDDTVFGG